MNGFNEVDVQNNFQKTTLHSAVRHNYYEIVKYLVEHGSKSYAKSEAWLKDESDFESKTQFSCFRSETILQLALSHGNLKIWRYLLKNSSIIDAKVNSTLHSAVREDKADVVKNIVEQKNLDKNSIDSRLAVYIAVENGREEILKILLDAGYSFKTCFRDRSPLHVAATFNHTRLIEMLLNAGADLNSKTEKNETCLHFAAAAGQSAVVKFLLETGIDTTNCEMVLEYALRRGNYEDELWTLSPFMYKNVSNITKMLLIPEISRTTNPYELWDKLSYSANKITVSEQSEQESSFGLLQEEALSFWDEIEFKKYRNEFLILFLNHLSDFEMKSFSKNIFVFKSLSAFLSELMHIICEYNDYRSSFYENCFSLMYSKFNDFNLSLLLIGQIEDDNTIIEIFEDRNSSIDEEINNDLTDYLKLLTARLFIISDSYFLHEQQFYKKHNLIEWRDECEREVKLMKETEIANECRVTFYDILTQTVNKIANYTKNDSLLQNVESSYMRFPAYAEFLKLNIQKGKRRRALIDKCMNSMLNLIEKNNAIQFTTIGIKQIFQYLSGADMRRLLAAFS